MREVVRDFRRGFILEGMRCRRSRGSNDDCESKVLYTGSIATEAKIMNRGEVGSMIHLRQFSQEAFLHISSYDAVPSVRI